MLRMRDEGRVGSTVRLVSGLRSESDIDKQRAVLSMSDSMSDSITMSDSDWRPGLPTADPHPASEISRHGPVKIEFEVVISGL